MIAHYEIQQKTPEWHHIRNRHFTASAIGEWALEPRAIAKTIPQLHEILEAECIPFKKSAKKDDLIALIPNPESLLELVPAAFSAILSQIEKDKIEAIRDKHPSERTEWEQLQLDWSDEAAEQAERKMANLIPIRRGNALEPEARSYYESDTGYRVTECGFISHERGGFGASPDGLVLDGDEPMHGLEIKCPDGATHNSYLLKGGLPAEYKMQVHMSMAVSGLSRWDFLSYNPGEPAHLVTVERDEFTDRLEQGLIDLIEEKEIVKARLAALWETQTRA